MGRPELAQPRKEKPVEPRAQSARPSSSMGQAGPAYLTYYEAQPVHIAHRGVLSGPGGPNYYYYFFFVNDIITIKNN